MKKLTTVLSLTAILAIVAQSATLEERATMVTDTKSKLQEMRDKFDAIDDLIDTLDLNHHEAYTIAANKHLKKDNGKPGPDYMKLEDGETQEKFAQEMADFYLVKAREKFGISKSKELSETDKNMLLNAYAGFTKDELLELLRHHKKDFKLDLFSGFMRDPRTGFLAQVRAKMTPSAQAHIRDTPKELEGIVE